MGASDGSGGAPVMDTTRLPIREGESDGATNELYSHEMETIPITENIQVSLFAQVCLEISDQSCYKGLQKMQYILDNLIETYE